MSATKRKQIRGIPKNDFIEAVRQVATDFLTATGSLPTTKTNGYAATEGLLSEFTWPMVNDQAKAFGYKNLKTMFEQENIKENHIIDRNLLCGSIEETLRNGKVLKGYVQYGGLKGEHWSAIGVAITNGYRGFEKGEYASLYDFGRKNVPDYNALLKKATQERKAASFEHGIIRDYSDKKNTYPEISGQDARTSISDMLNNQDFLTPTHKLPNAPATYAREPDDSPRNQFPMLLRCF